VKTTAVAYRCAFPKPNTVLPLKMLSADNSETYTALRHFGAMRTQ
jgi:hypothetical protein